MSENESFNILSIPRRNSKKDSVSRWLAGFFGICMFMYIGRTIVYSAYSLVDEGKSDWLQVSAQELSARCPITQEDSSRLDIVYITKDDVLVYDYTLPRNYADISSLSDLKNRIREHNLHELQSAKASQRMDKYRIRYAYSYRDSSGKQLFTIELEPGDYMSLWEYLFY